MATQDNQKQLENRVLGVTFAGWALDAMDFMCFALITPVLIRTLGMSHGKAGAITSAALCMRPATRSGHPSRRNLAAISVCDELDAMRHGRPNAVIVSAEVNTTR